MKIKVAVLSAAVVMLVSGTAMANRHEKYYVELYKRTAIYWRLAMCREDMATLVTRHQKLPQGKSKFITFVVPKDKWDDLAVECDKRAVRLEKHEERLERLMRKIVEELK